MFLIICIYPIVEILKFHAQSTQSYKNYRYFRKK